MTGRSYGQYCGLAKALDHVGDRWTLLVIRELLIGPRRYTQIRSALPGVATNLLADRLTALEKDGIVARGPGGGYELTALGRGLQGAVFELVRWGGTWMDSRGPEESFRPEWLAVALEALLPRWRSGSIEVRTGDCVVHVTRARVGVGGLDDPDAVVEGSPERILAVAAGRAPLSTLRVRGDRKVAADVLGGQRRAR